MKMRDGVLMIKEKEEKKEPCPNCSQEKGMMPPMYGSHGECRLCKLMFKEDKDGVRSKAQ